MNVGIYLYQYPSGQWVLKIDIGNTEREIIISTDEADDYKALGVPLIPD